MTKPFTPMELMARVNSQLRRYRKFLEKLAPQENVHVIGGLEINEDAVEVTMDGKPVKLTPIEYKILLLLAKNPGRVFSSEEIYERPAGEESGESILLRGDLRAGMAGKGDQYGYDHGACKKHKRKDRT